MQTEAHFHWCVLIVYLANICAYFGLTICLEEKVTQGGSCLILPVCILEQEFFGSDQGLECFVMISTESEVTLAFYVFRNVN